MSKRFAEYHNGVAVIRDKSLHKEAMRKLAGYEDAEEEPNDMEDLTNNLANYVCDLCCMKLDHVRSSKEAEMICRKCKLSKFLVDICNEYNKLNRFVGSEIKKLAIKNGELGKKLKEYKDLEEQGLLLKLPMQLGKPYYEIVESCRIQTFEFRPAVAGRVIQRGLFGKTVFTDIL